MALWSRLFSGIFGVGVGIAAADAIEPVVEVAKQEAWRENANRVLGPGELAALLAQGLLDLSTAVDHSERSGFAADRLAALSQLAMKAPTHSEAQDLRRREKINREQLFHAFAKEQIEPQYWEALADLVDERLSPQVVALAIVRGLIADPGILPVSPPAGEGNVPKFPVFDVDAIAEAKASGYDLDRLSVLAGIAGRPMSAEAAAEAYFKGILELVDYQRAVSESDVRNEWRDAILENQRFRLRPTDYAGLWLRGWIDEQEANAGGALYGATPETMLRLYQNRGRPATPRQVRIGYARGARHAGSANVSEAIQTAVKQSDIRAEWGAIEEAASYSLPSPFVLRQLTTSGAITGDDAHTYLVQLGWPDELARKAADFWSGGTAAAPAMKWFSRAQTSTFNRVHTEFTGRQLTRDEALEGLAAAGVPAPEAALVVDLWMIEANLIRTELTQAQIVKAYRKALYTRDEALIELQERGLTAADAEKRLEL